MIAILEAHRAGLLQREHWLPNLISGVIVGVVALPLAMAFSIASGAKPEQGLYTSIIAGLCATLFGGSRLQISGPTGAFIVILAGITAQHGIAGLQIATVMAGIILLILGLVKMGAVIRYIPDPVIVGFTAGIAIIIWVGQWGDFFGLPKVEGDHFHRKLWNLLVVLPDLHPATAGLALLSLALVILPPYIPFLKRVPGPLLALIAASAVQSYFAFPGVATIRSVYGEIPRGLPGLVFPEITLSRILQLTGPAFTIAMLGAIESLLSAVVADGMAGTRHDSNQELVGQGVANIAAPMFGGFAATAAIARTATNIRNGGTGPLSGIVHSLTLVFIVLFLAPLASNIPLASLAAILFVVAYNMSDLRHFLNMARRAPRADVAILMTTFLLTVFADLVVAVNIGVILATLHFLRKMSASVEVQQLGEEYVGSMEAVYQSLRDLPKGVVVYSIDGPFFFGAVENFEHALAQTHTDPRVVILRLHRVPFADITGLLTLEESATKLRKRGVAVLLCEANETVRNRLERAGVIEAVSAGNCLPDFPAALERARALLPVKTAH